MDEIGITPSKSVKVFVVLVDETSMLDAICSAMYSHVSVYCGLGTFEKTSIVIRSYNT